MIAVILWGKEKCPLCVDAWEWLQKWAVERALPVLGESGTGTELKLIKATLEAGGWDEAHRVARELDRGCMADDAKKMMRDAMAEYALYDLLPIITTAASLGPGTGVIGWRTYKKKEGFLELGAILRARKGEEKSS